MDFSSPEDLAYEEPSHSPIHREPICLVPLTTLTTETMLAESLPSPTPSPSPTSSPKPSGTEPSLQTTQPEPETHKIKPKSVSKEIIQLFPHSTSDLVFKGTPLTSLPPQSGPFTPNLTISSKPIMSSQPRTTISAPSSPRKEDKKGNLIP